MSHYKPYPAYKDSGVEWLGKVPKQWEITKFGRLLKEPPCYGVLVPDFQDGGVPMLRITDMENANLDKRALTTISTELSQQYTRTIVKSGDVVISVVGTIGKVFIVSPSLSGCNLSRAIARIQVKPLFLSNFVCLIIGSAYFNRFVDLTCLGAAQRVLNMGDLSAFLIALPSIAEQAKIIAHIDRETTRIDTLIAKKTRFIELLKEKRQALITQAVTKGLNPNVKMKDSGVEWLGEVPEHWGVQAIKLIASVGNGCTPNRENKQYWENGFYPWLTSTLVNLNEVRKAEEFITQVALDECSLPKIPPPAVLIGLTGQGRTRGMATTLYIEATISQHIAYIKPIKKHIEIEYLRSAMDSVYLFLRDESDGGGSTKGAVTCDQIKSLKIPIPPINEQISIAEFIRESTERITSVTEKTQLSITLLKERRSALITAAVTGQIDLREAA